MGDVGQWKPYPIIPLPSQSLATHCYRELALPSSGANPSQKKHRCQPQVLFRYTELNSDPRGRQAKDYGQRAIFSASFGHWFCLARVLNLHSSRYFQLLPMTVAHDFKALKMSDAVGIPMTTLQHTPSWAQARPDSSRKMSAQWWQRKQQNLAMPATASVLSTPPERIEESNNLQKRCRNPVCSGFTGDSLKDSQNMERAHSFTVSCVGGRKMSSIRSFYPVMDCRQKTYRVVVCVHCAYFAYYVTYLHR